MGTVMFELYWKHAPNTCRNFAELARRGYYNGVKFHRIIKDFMIQGGDPTGTGSLVFFLIIRQFYIYIILKACVYWQPLHLQYDSVISSCNITLSKSQIFYTCTYL